MYVSLSSCLLFRLVCRTMLVLFTDPVSEVFHSKTGLTPTGKLDTFITRVSPPHSAVAPCELGVRVWTCRY